MANNEIKQTIDAAEVAAAQSAQYRKIFAYCGAGVAVAVIAILVWFFGFRTPGIEAGNKAIAEIDTLLITQGGNLADSTVVEGYMNVANEYGYDAGNRAAYMAAAGLYRQGKYEEALKYIKKFSSSDALTEAFADGIKGDCYVNLDKYDDAVKAFSSAIKAADANPILTPYFMSKKAVVLAEQGKHDEAAKLYAEIDQKYPDYSAATAAAALQLQQEALNLAK